MLECSQDMLIWKPVSEAEAMEQLLHFYLDVQQIIETMKMHPSIRPCTCDTAFRWNPKKEDQVA
jgi:hypothetical protein